MGCRALGFIKNCTIRAVPPIASSAASTVSLPTRLTPHLIQLTSFEELADPGGNLTKSLGTNTFWIGANLQFDLDTGHTRRVLQLVFRQEDATTFNQVDAEN